MSIDLSKHSGNADIPTPKPMAGIWMLMAPNGTIYRADSPIGCLRAEQGARIPSAVALGRIARAVREDFPDDYEV